MALSHCRLSVHLFNYIIDTRNEVFREVFQLGTQRCCDGESTSMTLIQRRVPSGLFPFHYGDDSECQILTSIDLSNSIQMWNVFVC